MGAKNTQFRVGKAHYKAKVRQTLIVRLTECQQDRLGDSSSVMTGGSVPATSPWLPAFITAINITPGSWNRSQNVAGEEEKQKGAWERILTRRKRPIKQGQLEVKAEVSYWNWTLIFLDFLTKQQSCSDVPRVCLLCPFTPILHRGSVSRASHVFHKSRRQGCAGSSWTEHRAHRNCLLAFREATQNVWLKCLVACGKITFLCSDFCEAVLCPCGLMQGLRDSDNLHLEDLNDMRSQSMLLPEDLPRHGNVTMWSWRNYQIIPNEFFLVN